MQPTSVPSGIEPIIKYFYGTGQIMAACVSGLVGDLKPSDNRAIIGSQA